MNDEVIAKVEQDKSNIVVDSDILLTSSDETKPEAYEESDQFDVEITEPVLTVEIEGGGVSVIPTEHSKLNGLDYASSGHTGFASSEDVVNVLNRVSAVEVNVLNLTNEINRLDTKIDNKVQTVDNIPTDATMKQYFFKIIE